MKNPFILTGGPGAGKSTLVAALAARGMTTMPEAGRAAIQEQVASGGSALPWANQLRFADLMFEQDLHSYSQALELPGPVVFDRGIPDVAGYLRLCQLPVPEQVWTAARTHRYERTVFFAPPWKEIYVQDAERKQEFAEAVATYETLKQTYLDLSYEPVELPQSTVEVRVEFVLSKLTV